jgi:hypothetical protein
MNELGVKLNAGMPSGQIAVNSFVNTNSSITVSWPSSIHPIKADLCSVNEFILHKCPTLSMSNPLEKGHGSKVGVNIAKRV